MKIDYKSGIVPATDQIIELYDNAGLPRPTDDKARIKKMFENSNLIVTAWDGELLIGIARSVTDRVWCCYLADLAVRHEYKGTGTGRKLIELTREMVGEESMVLLLSVPSAMDYYPKAGFQKVMNGFIINRKR